MLQTALTIYPIWCQVYWLISRQPSCATVHYLCYLCVQNSFLYNLFLNWSRERLDAGHARTILRFPHLQWLLNHLEVVLVKDINQLLVVSIWSFGVWTTALCLLLSWVSFLSRFIHSHCNHIETFLFQKIYHGYCHLNCLIVILVFIIFLMFLIQSSHSCLFA